MIHTDTFKQFFDKYYTPAVRLSWYILGNKEDAEEIVMDAFMRVFEKWDMYKDNQHTANSLFLYSKNAALNFVEKRNVVSAHDTDMRRGWEESNTDIFIGNDELYNKVSKAIIGMTPHRKRIFDMLFIENKTLHDIASTLSISYYTVKELRAKALQHIRNNIKLQ